MYEDFLKPKGFANVETKIKILERERIFVARDSKKKTDESVAREIGREFSFSIVLDLLFFLIRGAWRGIRGVFTNMLDGGETEYLQSTQLITNVFSKNERKKGVLKSALPLTHFLYQFSCNQLVS